MNIRFDTSKLNHITDISCYNKNYYTIPFSIEGCTVLYEQAQDDVNEVVYVLGSLDDQGKFVGKVAFLGDMNGNINLLEDKLKDGDW